MASANLARTPSSAGSTTTGTFSFWIKGNLATGANQNLYSVSDGTNTWQMWININGQLDFHAYNGSSYVARVHPARKLRDTNAWYHIVCTIDTTNATAGDRLRLYINGERYTGAWTAEVQPTQNLGVVFCKNSTTRIGSEWDNSDYFEGNMAHFHLIDGTAYNASTFGETDTTTGIWKPKTSPSVTYGTNGFFLKFDNSGNMGLDSSGQSNNFTTNGTIIQNKDTPSNVFNCLSPIDVPIQSNGNYGVFPTLSNVNTSITNTNSAFREIRSNIYVTKGKYYFEAKPTRIGGSGAFQVGVQLRNYSSGSGERRAYQNNGYKYTPGSASYGASYAANDVVGVALNLDDGEITFYKNGVSQGVAATDMLSGMDNIGWTAAASCYDADAHFNFGNGYFGTTAVTSAQNPDDGIGIFEYDPPTGYRAICTKSLNAQEYS